MNFFRSLGVALWAWQETLRHVADLRIWSPLLLVTLLRLLGLIAIVFFHHPLWVETMAPLVRWLGSDAALHYPDHLYLLPATFRRFDTLLVFVAGALAMGMVSLRFARAFGSLMLRPDRRGALRHLPALLLLVAVGLVVDAALPRLIQLVPQEIREGGMLFRLVFLVIRWGCLTVLLTLLAYGVASIVVRGRGVLGAVGESLRVVRAEPLLTLTLVVLPMGLLFPLFVASDIDLAERGVPPEAVVILVFARILAELGLGFLLLGSLSRVYVWMTEVKR